jgi:uncharacterized protein YjbJ (UPF0337 family)
MGRVREREGPTRAALGQLDQLGACSLRDKERKAMKPSTKDQAKGTFENLKGKIKEGAGIITGRRKLEAEGKDQKLAGRARKKLGQVEKVFGK